MRGMIDKKQVMFDIECCICHVPDGCRYCSHYTETVGFGCMENLMSDALTILNDRKKTKASPIMGTLICECHNCKRLLAEGMNYCPVCGYEISEAPWKTGDEVK